MKEKLLYLAVLACGAAIGSAATWQYFKNKYEKQYQEDLKSVKEAFANKPDATKEEKNEPVEEEQSIVKPRHVDVNKEINNNIIINQGYTREENNMNEEKPYVITPEEFGEYEEYECATLFLFADGFMTDGDEELIDDIEEVVGYESLKHMGEYEDNCVHVRNDAKMTDYEVLRDLRNYKDVYNNRM